MAINQEIKRVFWVVLDGVGVGELPDASQYQDQGSNSFQNTAKVFFEKQKRMLHTPHLENLGLGHLTAIQGVSKEKTLPKYAFYGKALEKSQGKDTTSGHWEMAGLPVKTAFPTFPNGFPKEILEAWEKENGLPGSLGNIPASGTEIIEKLGEEHIKTGKPIVYTSADSVWQIAAHEEFFGLEKLYQISKSARKFCDELQIGRVIARPFLGNPEKNIPFKRTYNRKDYSLLPPGKTVLDLLVENQVRTHGIGKISNIFAAQGIQTNQDTKGNTDGLKVLEETVKQKDFSVPTLYYCNLIDTDMLYGHRRDPIGYGNAIEEFDQSIGRIIPELTEKDLLIITSDHGNDPTFPGTDHTREYVPILGYSKSLTQSQSLGVRETFSDMGKTILEALLPNQFKKLSTQIEGSSFYSKVVS